MTETHLKTWTLCKHGGMRIGNGVLACGQCIQELNDYHADLARVTRERDQALFLSRHDRVLLEVTEHDLDAERLARFADAWVGIGYAAYSNREWRGWWQRAGEHYEEGLDWRKRAERAEADAAAMRERVEWIINASGCDDLDDYYSFVDATAREAFATDAGSRLLARLQAAERVVETARGFDRAVTASNQEFSPSQFVLRHDLAEYDAARGEGK